MKLFLYAALLLSLAFIPGCGDSATNPSVETKHILPLAVGNQWIGRQSYLDIETGSMSVHFDTVTVTGSKVVEGETWFMSNNNSDIIRSNRSDGCYIWPVGFNAAFFLLIKYPAKVGDEFVQQIYIEVSSGDSVEMGMKLISVNDRVTVPAGSFSCCKYQYFMRRPGSDSTAYLDEYEYYAPGVGRVKADADNGSPDRNVWELVSYTVK